MKTAEELYLKHNNITHGFEFREALAEHDAEIIKIIDEMIEEGINPVVRFTSDAFNKTAFEALIELKEKLK